MSCSPACHRACRPAPVAAIDRDRGDGCTERAEIRPGAERRLPAEQYAIGARARSPPRRLGSPPPDRCRGRCPRCPTSPSRDVPADAAVRENGHDRALVRGHRDGPGVRPPVASVGPNSPVPAFRLRKVPSAQATAARPPEGEMAKARTGAGAGKSSSRGRAPFTFSCSLIVSFRRPQHPDACRQSHRRRLAAVDGHRPPDLPRRHARAPGPYGPVRGHRGGPRCVRRHGCGGDLHRGSHVVSIADREQTPTRSATGTKQAVRTTDRDHSSTPSRWPTVISVSSAAGHTIPETRVRGQVSPPGRSGERALLTEPATPTMSAPTLGGNPAAAPRRGGRPNSVSRSPISAAQSGLGVDGGHAQMTKFCWRGCQQTGVPRRRHMRRNNGRERSATSPWAADSGVITCLAPRRAGRRPGHWRRPG